MQCGTMFALLCAVLLIQCVHSYTSNQLLAPGCASMVSGGVFDLSKGETAGPFAISKLFPGEITIIVQLVADSIGVFSGTASGEVRVRKGEAPTQDIYDWKQDSKKGVITLHVNDEDTGYYYATITARSDETYWSIYYIDNTQSWSYEASDIALGRFYGSSVTRRESIAFFGGCSSCIQTYKLNARSTCTYEGWESSKSSSTSSLSTTNPRVAEYKPNTKDYGIQAKIGHSMVIFKDTSLFVFGGQTIQNLTGRVVTNDVWKGTFGSTSNQQTESIAWELQKPKTSAKPSERSLHAVYMDGYNMYIYGGRAQNGSHLADFWSYNTDSSTWTQVADVPSPEPVLHPQLMKRLFTMYLFGSIQGEFVVYSYSATSSTWKKVKTSGTAPPPQLEGFSLSQCIEDVLIYGGIATIYGDGANATSNSTIAGVNATVIGREFSSTLYNFNLKSGAWSIKEQKGAVRPGRAGHTSSIYRNKMYILGGVSAQFYSEYSNGQPVSLWDIAATANINTIEAIQLDSNCLGPPYFTIATAVVEGLIGGTVIAVFCYHRRKNKQNNCRCCGMNL